MLINGLFAAGRVIGTVFVIATYGCSSEATGPGPTPGAFTPNLPTNADLQLIFDTRFANPTPEGVFNSEGYTWFWDGHFVTDGTGPHATTVFETRYPGNDLGNGVGGAKLQTAEDKTWRRMYFSLEMWVQSDYSIHSNTEKFFYPLTKQNGVDGAIPINWGTGFVEGTGPNASTFGFAYQPTPGAGGEFQTGAALVTKAQWTRVEMYMVMNTPDTSDGVLKIWVNGAVAEDKTDMRYLNGSTQAVWRGMRFDGTRGGGASNTPTPAGGQVRRYNRLAFYAAP